MQIKVLYLLRLLQHIGVRKHEAGTGTYYYNRTVRDDNANHSERGLSWITVQEVAA